ncbi:hypothetical protein M407DRAFT_32427 [Tulasnella calospora MUT 4182]|uniref:Ribonuclease H1 N-terminal domain-containing protein n=1 Tax=Tulasnella calospora MUT 4182 TaxID=1051891 RepID=A0A0C3Q4R8_9AGAM|nr:hypothetical protein M407DRAFT_32427 [Tulasnella calospora MUT 4182]
MDRYYSVRVGRAPGVYRTWREAQAQTNRFPGAIHASFSFLTDAVLWSEVSINRQPRWVQSEMGVPVGAPVSPGPNISTTPEPPAAGPPVGPPPLYSTVTDAPANRRTRATSTNFPNDHSPAASSSAAAQAPGTSQDGAVSVTLESPTSSNSLTDDEYDLGDVTFEEILAAESVIGLHAPNPTSQRAIDQGSRLVGVQGEFLSGQMPRDDEDRTSDLNPSSRLESEENLASPRNPLERQGRLVRGNTSGDALPLENNFEDDVGSAELYPLLSSPPLVPRVAVQATQIQADYSEWSSTYHPGWVQDSLLSDIFHPPAPTTPSDYVIANQRADRSTDSDDEWVDPFAPLPGGLFGARDQHPIRFRVNLHTGSPTAPFYSPALSFLLGRHAVNYMFMHYFSPGSTTVVANTYLRNSANSTAFIEELSAVGLPPRQAAYIWTIIRPEMLDSSILLTSSEVQVTGPNTASESSEGEQEDAGGSSDSGYGTVQPNPAGDTTGSVADNDDIEYVNGDADHMDVDESPDDIPDPVDVYGGAYRG